MLKDGGLFFVAGSVFIFLDRVHRLLRSIHQSDRAFTTLICKSLMNVKNCSSARHSIPSTLSVLIIKYCQGICYFTQFLCAWHKVRKFRYVKYILVPQALY